MYLSSSTKYFVMYLGTSTSTFLKLKYKVQARTRKHVQVHVQVSTSTDVLGPNPEIILASKSETRVFNPF